MLEVFGCKFADKDRTVPRHTNRYDCPQSISLCGWPWRMAVRQLKQMSRNGGQSLIKFLYNADGIRTNKIVDGANHVYTLNGTRIVSEAWGNHLVIYLYDESGSPIGLQYRTKSYAANVFDTFYLEKNLQGDIVAVYNADGDKIGSYTYDAWGNCTVTVVSVSTTLEKNVVRSYNPFRYRGYYYDTETQLYYLQSRYYNPAWGRFLNVDAYISTGTGLLGYNMYAYCGNSPVIRIDSGGRMWQLVPALHPRNHATAIMETWAVVVLSPVPSKQSLPLHITIVVRIIPTPSVHIRRTMTHLSADIILVVWAHHVEI